MVTKVQNGCQIKKSFDLGKIWFPSRLWCCELIFIVGLLWWPFLIQNGHQNTKILLFGAKFGFQVDYDVANWYPSLVWYSGHFESKMATKIQKSSDLGEIWFPSRFWCWELISMVWEPYYDLLCRNIHRSMLQLLGVGNGRHCNQGTKWPPNTKILRFGWNLVSK